MWKKMFGQWWNIEAVLKHSSRNDKMILWILIPLPNGPYPKSATVVPPPMAINFTQPKFINHHGKAFSLKSKLMVRFEYFVIKSPKKLARKSIEKRLSERKPSPISQFRVFLASHVKKVKITRLEKIKNDFWLLVNRSKKQLISNMDLGGGGGDGYHRKSSKCSQLQNFIIFASGYDVWFRVWWFRYMNCNTILNRDPRSVLKVHDWPHFYISFL